MVPLFLAVATATTSLFAAAGARIHPSSDTAAVRAQAGLTQSIWDAAPYSLVLELGAAFSTAERTFAQGDVRLFLVSGALAIEVRHDFRSISVGIGPRAEIGWGLVDGSTGSPDVEEHDGRGLVVAAGGGLSVHAPLERGFGLSLLVEGGFTIRGLEAVVEGEGASGWRGAFICTTAGLWFDL